MKVTHLDTEIPDILTNTENDDDEMEEDSSQRELIAEAFQDDDLLEEFSKEKSNEIAKNKPKDINLTLPGWGNWGGTGIVPSKRKQKRFVVKAPKKVPRRDDNKGFLIINEDATKKLKSIWLMSFRFLFKG
ncbi:hypothetical protein HHI36_015484 [Cryptolaemus montrouzieri]|uniref:Uncharacterized protein n=1 Tax=Cryptolaemus montrouzieri TaxID=559131 RepID=A0ABD2N5P3_9CUCU